MKTEEKLDKMNSFFSSAGKCSVAFSGGVDSTFLLAAAVKALGSENVIALTAVPPYVAGWEIKEADELAEKLGIVHIKMEMDIKAEIQFNPGDRCYICKKSLFSQMKERAEKEGFPVLCDGSNSDDKGDYRPGMRALSELEIRSPMLEADLTKEEIRRISREWGLSTWSKPPYACLLTRIPHDTRIEKSMLEQIEKSEVVMMEEGFPYVRVRYHGDIARLEIPRSDFKDFIGKGHYGNVDRKLKELGFRHVTLDLGGYKMGNMNKPEGVGNG